MPRTDELFDGRRLPDALRTLLAAERPWEVLHAVDGFVAAVDDHREGSVHPTAIVEGPVVLGPGAVVGPFAWIQGPAWIGEGVRIGHAAIVRGGCVLGPGANVGHASEVKRSLLLPGAKAPHFNYVGDSVLGADVNLGAGVKIANLKNDDSEVTVAGEGTGLRKFGAALGDDVHLGCNVVLSPGTVIGSRTLVYAGAVVRGVISADRIVKHRPVLEDVPRQSGR
jgi:bifunctional UDP-N-acetylglucosamine pyrophosphorylase/glucosamine-1-phosphate N-acetyltransferase